MGRKLAERRAILVPPPSSAVASQNRQESRLLSTASSSIFLSSHASARPRNRMASATSSKARRARDDTPGREIPNATIHYQVELLFFSSFFSLLLLPQSIPRSRTGEGGGLVLFCAFSNRAREKQRAIFGQHATVQPGQRRVSDSCMELERPGGLFTVQRGVRDDSPPSPPSPPSSPSSHSPLRFRPCLLFELGEAKNRQITRFKGPRVGRALSEVSPLAGVTCV